MNRYYTDNGLKKRPQTTDTIGQTLWEGLRSLIEIRIGDGSFGFGYPEQCPDPYAGPCGCDREAFRKLLLATVPEAVWPLDTADSIRTPVILEILEFCASAVGKPIHDSYHKFYSHHHLHWDRDEGLKEFVNQVNLLFKQNGVAYELTEEGKVRRIMPEPLAESFKSTRFDTGDADTDRLLEQACRKILLPKEDDRRAALEKLWDAFERIKTLEPGSDKRCQANAMLELIAPPNSKFRDLVDKEASTLTNIGNSFCIRHFETSQENLTSPTHSEYLFWRLFVFIRLVLKESDRGG